MYLLALDTATNAGGVAVSRNSETIGLVMLKTPLQYGETLVSLIDFLLHSLDVKFSQIDALAVSIGPGSFTGLRVGLSVAKGLSQPRNLPLVGISTLEALACRFRDAGPRVAPMIDARRQQIYGALYRVDEPLPVLEHPEAVAAPAQWLRNLPASPCLFAGDGAQLYRQSILAARPQARILDTDNLILAELCRLGYLRVSQGMTVTAAGLRANYVRPSDAELAGSAGASQG